MIALKLKPELGKQELWVWRCTFGPICMLPALCLAVGVLGACASNPTCQQFLRAAPADSRVWCSPQLSLLSAAHSRAWQRWPFVQRLFSVLWSLLPLWCLPSQTEVRCHSGWLLFGWERCTEWGCVALGVHLDAARVLQDWPSGVCFVSGFMNGMFDLPKTSTNTLFPIWLQQDPRASIIFSWELPAVQAPTLQPFFFAA